MTTGSRRDDNLFGVTSGGYDLWKGVEARPTLTEQTRIRNMARCRAYWSFVRRHGHDVTFGSILKERYGDK